ncbi:MAG TPA: CBS domain-containing protein [Phycisphaerae bacterium]|nr:CBS domain-containing protein [Phycisphaerae bacterium]HON67846.1 CBS domain-containing protein [Phycisphaerae bacterium]HOQ87736.1 CBS domain-containing protein [Phycisphaerae bacterium]HPU25156.1 CBS domain-containing protein [Phycisphaerae bacterium]HPZ96710.1 CBS domain-containing protein [Phycisphaerae bacterium]
MATAKDILDRKGNAVLTIGPDETILTAARRMNDHRVGALVVVDPAIGMVGILTERDILSRVVAEARSPETTRVREVMTGKVVHCTPATTVQECEEIMTRRRLRHLPTMENGQLVGLISIGDLMAYEAAQQQVTIEYMHQYIHGRA